MRNQRPDFQGSRFNRPIMLPTRTKPTLVPEVVEEPRLKFPISIQAAGVTRGPQWCQSCSRITQGEVCSSCGGAMIIPWRQLLLHEAKQLELGKVQLVREQENPIDKYAIAIYLVFPKDRREHVGYIPAKNSPLTASQLSPLLDAGQKFWTSGLIVGGPQDGRTDLSYGLRVTIYDQRPV